MSLAHRLRDRHHLTVVMFHRVLPEAEQVKVAADTGYTVAPEMLASCLEHFRKHYNLVSLSDLLDSRKGVKPLPAWPLFVTFDDGWRDNFEWARPVLQGQPWALFVAVDAMREPDVWWQEALLWLLRSRMSGYAELVTLAGAEQDESICCADLPCDLRLLVLYSRLSIGRRQEILSAAAKELSSRYGAPAMLSSSEVRRLHRQGIAIGSHGSAHLPLTSIPNACCDMRRARDELCQILSTGTVPAISFPHGRWNPALLDAARALGHELLFTSDPTLNPCPGGWLTNDVVGRISMDVSAFADSRGKLAPDRLTAWIQHRNRNGVQVVAGA